MFREGWSKFCLFRRMNFCVRLLCRGLVVEGDTWGYGRKGWPGLKIWLFFFLSGILETFKS